MWENFSKFDTDKVRKCKLHYLMSMNRLMLYHCQWVPFSKVGILRTGTKPMSNAKEISRQVCNQLINSGGIAS